LKFGKYLLSTTKARIAVFFARFFFAGHRPISTTFDDTIESTCARSGIVGIFGFLLGGT
jgi:hypothetical protein